MSYEFWHLVCVIGPETGRAADGDRPVKGQARHVVEQAQIGGGLLVTGSVAVQFDRTIAQMRDGPSDGTATAAAIACGAPACIAG